MAKDFLLFSRSQHLKNVFATIHILKISSLDLPHLVILSFLTHIFPVLSLIPAVIASLNNSQSPSLTLFLSANEFFNFLNSTKFDLNPLRDQIKWVITLGLGLVILVLPIAAVLVFKNDRAEWLRQQLVKIMVISIICFSLPISTYLTSSLLHLFVENKLFQGLLTLALLICALCIVYLLEQCSNSNDYFKNGSFSKISHSHNSWLVLLQLITKSAIISLQLNHHPTVVLLSLLALISFDLFQLRCLITQQKYLNTSTQILWSAAVIITLTLQIILLLNMVNYNELLMQNMQCCISTISLLGVLSIHIYRTHIKQQLLLHEDISNEESAILYMFELAAIGNQMLTKNIILSVLTQNHSQTCQNQQCYCHNSQQFKNNAAKKEEFVLRLIKSKLIKTVQLFPQSFSIQFIYLNFSINCLSAISQISHHLKKHLTKHGKLGNSFTLRQNYMIYQIEEGVRESMREINNSTQIDLNCIFQEDQMKKTLKIQISTINQKLVGKYSHLNQQFCSLNKIQMYCDQISQTMRLVETEWSNFSKDSSYNLQIFQIFLIYFQVVINIRKQANAIKKLISHKIQAISYLKGVNQKNIFKYLYSKKACVLQSNLSKDLGQISNISQNCSKIFNIPKTNLIGKNIHSLMADFLSQPHEIMIKKWLQNQSMVGTLLNITTIHFADKNSNCFTGNIYMKLKSIGLDILFYGIVIRDSNQQFILLNKKLQIEGIGEKLINDGLFNSSDIKTSFKRFCNIEDHELQQSDSITKRIYFKQNKSTKSLKNLSKKITSNLYVKDSLKFQCSIAIQKFHMGKCPYYAVKFMQIKKKAQSSSDSINKYKTTDFIKTVPTLQDRKKSITLKQIELNDQNSSIQQPKNIYDPTQFRINLQNTSSSINSFIINSNITIDKLRENIKNKMVDINLNQDNKEQLTSFVLVTFAILICSGLMGQVYLYKAGLDSFNMVVFADAAVSDNNQLFELAYNRIVMTKSYCFSNKNTSIERCSHLLQSSHFITNYLYDLIVSDMKVFNTNVTSFSQLPYYASYNQKVNVIIGKVNVSVSISEFMEYFYFALTDIGLEIISNSTIFPLHLLNSFNFLQQNWPTIKQINHGAISFYRRAGTSQLNTLSSYIYLLSIMLIILLAIPLMFVRNYHYYMVGKQIQITNIYKFIDSPVCKAMIVRCQQIQTCLEEGQQQYKKHHTSTKSKHRLGQDNKFYQQSSNVNILVLTVYCILVMLSLTSLVVMVSLFPSGQDMFTFINELMDSQNYAIENYLDLKNYYYQNTNIKTQNYNYLRSQLNQVQPIFSYYAKKSISVFSKYDSTFQNDFKNILIRNVCDQVVGLVQQWQLEDCRYNMHLNILQKGLVAGMVAFHRNTLSALIQLRYNSTTTNGTFFMADIYQDLDDYLTLMFRLYQTTQARMVQGFSVSINSTVSNITLIISLQITLILSGVIFWFCTIKVYKLMLANLFGSVLQLPLQLLRQNKKIFGILQSNLYITM